MAGRMPVGEWNGTLLKGGSAGEYVSDGIIEMYERGATLMWKSSEAGELARTQGLNGA